jgi:ligand-binding SRPBCC domain-containing protein
MADRELERRQVLPRGVDAVFAFFAEPRNLEAITPPWLAFRIVEAPERLARGALLRYRLRLYGVPLGWLTRIDEWQPPVGFVDRQLQGPYLVWVHAHRFTPVRGGTEVYDSVRYRVPGGPLAPHWLVDGWLRAIFDFRQERLQELLGAPPPDS